MNEAFSNTIDFYESYPNRVSGDFPGRFADAKGKKGALQAQNEITTAENLLDGNTPLGDIDNVYGIPQNTSNDSIPIPDFRATDISGNSRLVEVKTPDGLFTKNNLQENLKKAINQVKFSDQIVNIKVYITIDYSTKAPTELPRSEIERYSKFLIENAQGLDAVEFVEIFYKDNANSLQRLLLKVQNGEIITVF